MAALLVGAMRFFSFLRLRSRLLRALVGGLIALSPAVACARSAETSAELLAKLRSALTQETASRGEAEYLAKDRENAWRLSALVTLRTLLPKLRQYTGSERTDPAEDSDPRETLDALIAQINANSSSEAVHHLCADLLTQLGQERAARGSELDSLLDDAGDITLKATASKDLDRLLQKLGAYSLQSDNPSPKNAAIRTRRAEIEAAISFVSHWQTYLAAQAVGNLDNAAATLENLINEKSIHLVPVQRSELLTRLQQVKQAAGIDDSPSGQPNKRRREEASAAAEQILNRIKTLEDITPALAELNKLVSPREANSNDNAIAVAIRQLDSVNNSYRALQAGLPVSLSLQNFLRNGYGNSANGGVTISLVRQLFILALPRIVGLPQNAVKASADESVDSFLRRLTDEAKRRGDWPAVARCLEAGAALAYSGTAAGPPAADRQGYMYFFAARNQEQANQWAMAVHSYQDALRSGSLEMPIHLIGERLDALRREHPREYEEGMMQLREASVVPAPARRVSSPAGRPGINPGAPVPEAALSVPGVPSGSPSGSQPVGR